MRANSSPNLELEIFIQRAIFGLGHKVKVRAWCDKHHVEIENPFTGCAQCNEERPGLSLFAEALEEIDDDDDD
jgi:hypothetical protein